MVEKEWISRRERYRELEEKDLLNDWRDLAATLYPDTLWQVDLPHGLRMDITGVPWIRIRREMEGLHGKDYLDWIWAEDRDMPLPLTVYGFDCWSIYMQETREIPKKDFWNLCKEFGWENNQITEHRNVKELIECSICRGTGIYSSALSDTERFINDFHYKFRIDPPPLIPTLHSEYTRLCTACLGIGKMCSKLSLIEYHERLEERRQDKIPWGEELHDGESDIPEGENYG